MPSRRRTLSVLGTLTVAGLAGCSGTLDGGGPGEDGDENSSGEDSSADEEATTETESGAETDGSTDDGDGDGDDDDVDDDESGEGDGDENAYDVSDDETFLTISSDGEEIDAVRYGQVESASEPAAIDDQYVLPVSLTDSGSDSFREALEEAGAMESPTDAEMTAYREGEAIHSRQLSEEAIATAEANDFAGPFHVPLDSREQAEEIHEAIDSDES
ncbi:hypothetical protein [Natronoglomus mannanivorans]|uniref:Uncharacterized protein n=1 Tax=Natronoglomus mannanivorans TaxID=2979990 RepID=A0AAP2Z0C9_9EURY|nr:hypothetical protein [Halobacteria archaeon AArc-xg1-1]